MLNIKFIILQKFKKNLPWRAKVESLLAISSLYFLLNRAQSLTIHRAHVFSTAKLYLPAIFITDNVTTLINVHQSR